MGEGEGISHREQIQALIFVAKYRPSLTVGIITGGVIAAVLEGIGLSFILPIVEIVQSPGDPVSEADGILLAFVSFYQYFDIPFTLGFVVIGVSIVLTVRWTLTFVVMWLRLALEVDYIRYMQTRLFDSALDARVEYFDRTGSDDILNAIVTQAKNAGDVIRFVVNFIEQGFLALTYLIVAFVIAPWLATFAITFLGVFSLLFRFVLEPGYDIGDEVAEANERVQHAVQAGVQGIRDTKLFGLNHELFEEFLDSIDQFAKSSITLRRNEQAIQNFYNLLTGIAVFVLIYIAIVFAEMSLAELGVFLFAMFRLGPKASHLNSVLYQIENQLPHLVRTNEFLDELEQTSEPNIATETVPTEIKTIEFRDVRFSYDLKQQTALDGVSFRFHKGEFIGFVGRSGAGKSTIASLLARIYEPDSGEILANGRPIHEMDIEEWRSRIAVVRQDPFIFNDTLLYNLTIGNRDVTHQELNRVCSITRVDEFLSDLSDGYATKLGDKGVRLSGGQRQRIALARALLKDSDVLILDEATSDLDSQLEKEVQHAIEDMEREYAMVVIAHRFSSVKNADCIYTVADGNLIESGQHEELVDEGGEYAKLYSIQSQVK